MKRFTNGKPFTIPNDIHTYEVARKRIARHIRYARERLKEMNNHSTFRRILIYGSINQILGRAKGENEIIVDGIRTYLQVNKMCDIIENQAIGKLE